MSSGSSSKRRLRTSRAARDGRVVAGPDAVEACHQLPGAALTDAEPFLDRLAVEIVKGGVNLDHFGGAKVDQLVKG